MGVVGLYVDLLVVSRKRRLMGYRVGIVLREYIGTIRIHSLIPWPQALNLKP